MDYPLENLDPERFQLLCQSLVTRDAAGVQCFPVAQPDGGRDAVAYFAEEGKRSQFAVFQVKFVRNIKAENNTHKWLLGIIADEAPKIRNLIPKGASKFILITNVPGTAHLETGSIDKANEIISEALGLHAQCWWRDDINRRLDNAWDLKWIYPEIMTGPDFLRAIIEAGVTEEKERRASTIRSFLKHQYLNDEEVRFKQVELQNRLLDLFVDVPISIRDENIGRNKMHAFFRAEASIRTGTTELESASPEFADPSIAFRHQSPSDRIGAASLLMGSQTANLLKNIVIEGAPGQGKSTITQYVCQVHRMKLLHEAADLLMVPAQHRTAAVRLPIRVDLRDFATWLSRENPFSAAEGEGVPAGWAKSLESFLSALISNQSGGANFSIDDLLAIARVSSVILVFDGLDEVADVSRRKDVVDELTRGTQRLTANCASLQTVVTSRPAAFANSPGMPERSFIYLQLLSLSTERIMEYAERWIRARRLDSKLAAEFRRLLKTRLDQPHLRDLARNPMQLAILLSLIHTRGASLPDKRTALYDYYIDLFFSREAEKSAIVRDHRDLLIDLHGYLGWALHAEAEKGESRASISVERLERLVATYLEKEGHDRGLAAQLFTGVVERVVALVSRVEGTFEFEVQPLREYFAARFLFNSAPHSSPGKEKPGTRPDRFDALARNFYWLNVTRFYAGCYSKGELSSLVERLQELCREGGYRRISDPRALTATLLADWVFAQNPRSVQLAVDLILEGVGLRRLLADSLRARAPRHATPLVLPKQSGRDQLVAKCFSLLSADLARDFALELIELLKMNSASAQDHFAQWHAKYTAAAAISTEKANKWLYYGLQLGVLSTCSLEELRDVVGPKPPDARVISTLLRARRTDYLDESEITFDASVRSILHDVAIPMGDRKPHSTLELLSEITGIYRYSFCFRSRQPVPLSTLIRRRGGLDSQSVYEGTAGTKQFANAVRIREVARIAAEERSRPAAEWAVEIAPWSKIVEALRTTWGDTRIVLKLACVSAGIRSHSERCSDANDLLHDGTPLCRRARCARLKSTNVAFWSDQFNRAESTIQCLRVLLIGLCWATPATLIGSLGGLEKCLESLSPEDWRWLFYAARQCRASSRADVLIPKQKAKADILDLPASVSTRAACAIADVVPDLASEELYLRRLAHRWDEDSIVLEFAQNAALDLARIGSESWSPDLAILRQCYERGENFESHRFTYHGYHGGRFQMPLHVAEPIADNPLSFPGFLVRLADDRCREEVASGVVPLLDAAQSGDWFGA